MLPSARPKTPVLERVSALPLTGTSLPMGALTLSVMEFEAGPCPAPDAAPNGMQGRAYTPSEARSHGPRCVQEASLGQQRERPARSPVACILWLLWASLQSDALVCRR